MPGQRVASITDHLWQYEQVVTTLCQDFLNSFVTVRLSDDCGRQVGHLLEDFHLISNAIERLAWIFMDGWNFAAYLGV